MQKIMPLKLVISPNFNGTKMANTFPDGYKLPYKVYIMLKLA